MKKSVSRSQFHWLNFQIIANLRYEISENQSRISKDQISFFAVPPLPRVRVRLQPDYTTHLLPVQTCTAEESISRTTEVVKSSSRFWTTSNPKKIRFRNPAYIRIVKNHQRVTRRRLKSLLLKKAMLKVIQKAVISLSKQSLDKY